MIKNIGSSLIRLYRNAIGLFYAFADYPTCKDKVQAPMNPAIYLKINFFVFSVIAIIFEIIIALYCRSSLPKLVVALMFFWMGSVFTWAGVGIGVQIGVSSACREDNPGILFVVWMDILLSAMVCEFLCLLLDEQNQKEKNALLPTGYIQNSRNANNDPNRR